MALTIRGIDALELSECCSDSNLNPTKDLRRSQKISHDQQVVVKIGHQQVSRKSCIASHGRKMRRAVSIKSVSDLFKLTLKKILSVEYLVRRPYQTLAPL